MTRQRDLFGGETVVRRRSIDRAKHRLVAARWRAANPDKVRASRAADAVRERKRSRAERKYDAAAAAAYRAANRESIRIYKAAWAAAHRDRVRAYGASYVAAHPEKRRESVKSWERTHPEKHRAIGVVSQHRRRARKLGAKGSHTAAEFTALCTLYGGHCLACWQMKKLTADHVIPLSKGGSNSIDNIQPLCKSCNSKKSRKTIDYRPPLDFMELAR